MKIRKTSALGGLTIRMMMTPGTAPSSGPKKGMRFVTPTITLTSSA